MGGTPTTDQLDDKNVNGFGWDQEAYRVALVTGSATPSDQNQNIVSESNPLPATLVAGTSSVGNMYVVPPFTFPGTFQGNQTNVGIITPSVGKKLNIIGGFISSDDATFGVSLVFPTSSKTAYKGFEADDLGPLPPMNILGATDESLQLNIDNSPGQNWFFLINYDEVD